MKYLKIVLMALVTLATLNLSTMAQAGGRDYCVEQSNGWTVCYSCNQSGRCVVTKKYATKKPG